MRERRQAVRKIVSEIYSPPRITKELKKGQWSHLAPGIVLDLTVNDPLDGKPWDFDIEAKREKARRNVRDHKPFVVSESPTRTTFSTWQVLNKFRIDCPEQYELASIGRSAHGLCRVSVPGAGRCGEILSPRTSSWR